MKLIVNSSAQLSTHFKSLRKANGWSQVELGQKLGIGQARVAQIEGDPGSISVDKFLQILHLLNARLVIETRIEPVAAGLLRLNLQRHRESLEPEPGASDARKETQFPPHSNLLPSKPPLAQTGLLPLSKNSKKSSKPSITKKKW